MAHFDVNQAIASCKDKTFREVLPFLEFLCSGTPQAKVNFSTESLATAMHRIASTGANDPLVIGEVFSDRRFQALVHEVENRLRAQPHEFNNQSLANVVWGAGKLRLNHRPELFLAVEREVLSMNYSKRTLSSFTPQQLAAIAWGFVAAEMNSPKLFLAIQAEARAQPLLEDLLQKAGLLQHLRQRVMLPPGMSPSSFSGVGLPQYLTAHPQSLNGTMGVQGVGNFVNTFGKLPGPSHPPTNTNGITSGIPPAVLHGNPVPGAHGNPVIGAHHEKNAAAAVAQQVSPYLSPRVPQPHVFPLQQNLSPRVHSGHAPAVAPPPQHATHVSGTLSPPLRAVDVGVRSDVAVVAEEHKREMERKQREVLGDADSEGTCPLCIEPMDDTDICFLPCPCGYQICRLCYHRIVNNETKTCPACRAEYKEENIQKKSLPEKKKKDGETAEVGWETGAGKKKVNKEKKAAVPAYTGFPPKVRELLLHCHEIGHVVRGELDDRVLEDLRALPERGAIAVLNEFIKKDMSRIRNKCAFLHRIIQRVQQEEVLSEKSSTEKPTDRPIGASSTVGFQSLPPQRTRAVSDVGCSQRNGMSSTAATAANGNGSFGFGSYARGSAGLAEKENGGQFFYGAAASSLELNGGAGDLFTDSAVLRQHAKDEYLQSRPSLQLPVVYRPVNSVATACDGSRFKESSPAIPAFANPQFQTCVPTKEALSPAAGAAAGIKILALLQGSSGGAAAMGGDRKEKPPLFARGGAGAGGAAVREASAFRNGGAADAFESSLGRCGQCGLQKIGEIDTSDGNFYCEDCWKAFESSRNESALFSMVNM